MSCSNGSIKKKYKKHFTTEIKYANITIVDLHNK